MELSHAIVVGPGTTDAGAEGAVAKVTLSGIAVDQIVRYRLIHLRGQIQEAEMEELAQRLLVDAVGQWWMRREEHLPPDRHGRVTAIEVGLRPGVTDREGAELVRAAQRLGYDVTAASVASRYFVYGDISQANLYELVSQVLHNDVIERWNFNQLAPAFTDEAAESPATESLAITTMADEELLALSAERRLGLTLEEMQAIRAYFAGQDRQPTDAELETLAQTWSEHCSHKTFRAVIETPEGTVDGLLDTYLRAATDRINAPWVESAFVDNAGIVHFDEHFDLALKAETHNHPSALEPFGGANTGVGGVVRDILGVSARPIAITDVLCFGPEDLQGVLPPSVFHPLRIRTGVIAGIADYGNKIGVPTIAGAIFHDRSYTTTPLVFAGCIGLLPRGSNPTNASVGDYIVVLGGRVGRDGVGGATFSSQTMNDSTAESAGSSVQIGDPVVEKGLIDLVIEARDRKLYNAITDCGAGGLSSAVGEMAEQLGARVDLAAVPRKYPGLAPWEAWLSEAQERMVVACTDPEPLVALAELWHVEATVIGHFTGDGRLSVVDGNDHVVDLDTGFMHGGRPRLHLETDTYDKTRPPRAESEAVPGELSPSEALMALLAHPSIRSNEAVVRQYDHEVLGGTVIRPYGGVELDGPADGTAVVPPGTLPTQTLLNDNGDSVAPVRAAAIGIGASLLVGRHDPEAMAWAAVDEAIRNAVVAGADPARLSLLDNFAWGNPHRRESLAALVAACRGCHDAAIANGAPFVSGKDSLFNEFVFDDGSVDPVTPTLIITAVGVVPDISTIPSTGVVEAGNDVWLVGPTFGSLGGSYVDEVIGRDLGGPVQPPDPGAAERHRHVHQAISHGLVMSAHDISDGGLAVAAAEWAFAGRRGMTLSVDSVHRAEQLFGEAAGRYLLEVAPADADVLAEIIPSATRIGWLTDDDRVRIGVEIDVSLAEIGDAYAGHDRVEAGPVSSNGRGGRR